MTQEYQLSCLLAFWPPLVKSLRNLHCRDTDQSLRLDAAELARSATTVAQGLAALEARSIDQMWQKKEIVEEENKQSPSWKAFHFSDLHAARGFTYHAMSSIAVNRITTSAQALSGSMDPSLVLQTKEWSRRIWCTYPYVSTFKPLGCRFLIPAFILSFEAGSATERDYVLYVLNALEEYWEPHQDLWTEEKVLGRAWDMTGRPRLANTQDVTPESSSQHV